MSVVLELFPSNSTVFNWIMQVMFFVIKQRIGNWAVGTNGSKFWI